MFGPLFTIARYTLLEAARARLPWLALAMAAAAGGGALFLSEITITETARIQTTFLSASLRLGCVLVLTLSAVASLAREFQDKGLELILSLDIPRASYVLGKTAGFALVGLALALFCGLVLAGRAPAGVLALWVAALALELAIVAALAVFCAVALGQVTASVAVALTFYLVARSITGLELLAHSDFLQTGTAAQGWLTRGTDLFALLLPRLDEFAPSAWLADGTAPWADFPSLALQALVYVALLCLAAIFDLHRRNL